jgi:hypothetical protein
LLLLLPPTPLPPPLPPLPAVSPYSALNTGCFDWHRRRAVAAPHHSRPRRQTNA